MPSSHYSNINPTIKFFRDANPRPLNVMDLGCGKGNIGVAVRDVFPEVRFSGIDIFEKNVELAFNRTLKNGEYAYSSVVLQDIRQLFPIDAYDLFLAYDVLEHLYKEEAIKIILHYKGKLLVSIPLGEYPQGAMGGNIYEVHKATWYHDEIMEFATKCLYKGRILGVYLC